MVVNSKSELCNLALDLLLQSNEEIITNIDIPTTNTEVVCKRWYDVTRKATLRKGIWNFALKRIILTPDAVPPVYGYTQSYNLPADFIRMVTIETEPGRPLNQKYEIEDTKILINTSDTASLYIKYIFDQTVVAKFDASFLDVLTMELALRMAYKFSASSSRVAQIEEMLQKKMASAQSIDGQERPPDIRDDQNISRRRRGDYGSDIVFYGTGN